MTNFNSELRKVLAIRIYEKQYVDLSPGAKRDVEDTVSAITSLVKGIVPEVEELKTKEVPKTYEYGLGFLTCRSEMLKKLEE